jgi:hypothetical protein
VASGVSEKLNTAIFRFVGESLRRKQKAGGWVYVPWQLELAFASRLADSTSDGNKHQHPNTPIYLHFEALASIIIISIH